MSTTFVVDRIEGETMVVVNQTTDETIDVPHALAPSLTEGDVFSIQSEASRQQTVLEDAQARLERLKATSEQPQPGTTFDL